MNEYKYILLWLKCGDASLAFWCHSCELCKIGCERCDSSTSPSLQLNNANGTNRTLIFLAQQQTWKWNRWNVIWVSLDEIRLGLMKRPQAHTCIALKYCSLGTLDCYQVPQIFQNTLHVGSGYFWLYNPKFIYKLILEVIIRN
jgi:hypothetical protein